MVYNKATFSKPERLCSKKVLADLFENGNSFFCNPFHVIWMHGQPDIPFPVQVAFSVTKKGFKLAVTRNLIKRRIREAYRKNKCTLYNYLEDRNKKLVIIIIFKGNSIPSYAFIEESVKETIKMIIRIIDKPEAGD